jgi:ubiquinone/menaquinone biosynthesis C-methylase UbiE
MPEHYQYPGEELFLFENAVTWKNYFGSKIRPYIKGNILEVGAGIGETTNYLLNTQVKQCTCLEPDASLFDTLSKKLKTGQLPGKCKAVHGSIKDLSDSHEFDTIVYIDVLEHIEDDHAEISGALRLLKSGGALIVLSPAYQFLYTNFDKEIGHYRRYTKKTLLKTISFSDLLLKQIFYLDSTGVVLLLLNKYVVRKKYPSEKDIKIWEYFFVPFSKLMDKILFYKFGKSIVGIWQKR